MKIIDKIKNSTFFKRKIRAISFKAMELKFRILPKKSLVDRDAEYDHELIVSLTSYPARFETLPITLKTIMYQTMKPNRIVLFLDENVERKNIPDSLLELERYGLEIMNRPYNLRCHKKYLHAISENPEADVITIDDDVMYNKHTIEELYHTHLNNPGVICAKRVHRILLNEKGELLPYEEWDLLCNSVRKPSNMLLLTGVGGVLYPPHCLSKDTLNPEEIYRLCNNQDDIWLLNRGVVDGIKVVWAETKYVDPPTIPKSQNVGLYKSNVNQNDNDNYMKILMNEFGINWNAIKQEEIKQGIQRD